MGFNQQSVNDNGGVAWAKQVAQTMDPGAIDSQIQGYQNAASSLANVQTTLQNVKNNLAASWSGDAAEQAQQSFQASINHTQQTQETILHSVIPPLQSAKSAQQTFMTSMNKVPNEQTVPSNSIVDDVGSFFGVASPAQKAEAHNTTVRTQAADALNSLSDSYESSATQLKSVSSITEGHLQPTQSTSAFNLGPVESSSGDGAASSYGESVSTGTYGSRSEYTAPPSGTVTPGPEPKTTLSGTGNTGGGGTITEAPPGQVGTTPPSNPPPFEPDPIWSSGSPVESDPGYGGGSGLITDEPGGGPGDGVGGGGTGDGVGEGGLGEGDYNGGSGKLGGNGGVFDETGMGDGELTGGTGTGLRTGMSNTDGSGLGGEGDTVGGSGGAGGMADGEGGESGMGGGSMGRGMGGGGLGSGDEELASSKYSRGRFIGVTEEDDNPSLSPVRSAFEGATDADGNKVDMMGSGRSGASGDDEEDERGKRPSYLKEDEFWKNAQRIVPPVIQ